MYSKLLIFIILFFGYIGTTFASCDHTGLCDWKDDIPDSVKPYLLANDIAGATSALTSWHEQTKWFHVNYSISISGNMVYIACDNGYRARYRKPPPPPAYPGVCGPNTGKQDLPLSWGSCVVGNPFGFTTSGTNPKIYSWSCSGENGWASRSCSANYATAECDPTVANNTLLTSHFSTPRCKYGNVTNVRESTDANKKTTYTWSCEKAGSPTVTCNAYSKPLCVPSATNGCCDERMKADDPANTTQFGHPPRLVDQCSYSVIPDQAGISMTGKVIKTQDGPIVVSLTWAYQLSKNGVTWNCQPPVDGKPRIVCDSDLSIKIAWTLRSFTLPSSITQSVGSCRVIFDAPDVCKKWTEDTITTKAFADCDPRITDYTNPKYCPTQVEKAVCVRIEDKFWNPVIGYATGKIVSRFVGKSIVNTYFEKYNLGRDATQYAEGTYTEVDGKYCNVTKKICTVVNGALCGTGCPDEATVTCNPKTPCDPTITDKTNPLFCQCVVGDPRPACQACVNTPTEPNKCGTPNPICIPTAANNYCKPYIHEPPTTVPGCESPDYTGDPLLCIEKVKACTAHLEVQDSLGNWTSEGDAIVYDEAMKYRIVMDGADTTCHNGIISVRQVSATGGTLSGSEVWNSDGTFTATVSRDINTTPLTARWPAVRAVFTQPGGITYGLTARADDFNDTPLSITGNRMKWVRIIGAAGANITSFNLNNAGVIGEDASANTVNMRNAILKNVWLLTRSVEPNWSKAINGVYYAEWDYTYTQLTGLSSSGFRTVIVRGNLTIDTSIPDKNSTGPIVGIIVVKRSNGTGGDIIVKNDVNSIRAVLFAEGSLYGETQLFGSVPLTKLILKGSLFSRNTIWWSADRNNLYLSGKSPTTDFATAFRQDLNNVRNGYGCPVWGPECYRNYPDPFIIEYEDTLWDPPPGFNI